MALVVVSISAFDMTSVADAISSGQSRDASRSKVVAELNGRELVVVVADANSVFRSGVVEVLARETDIRAVPAATAEMLTGLVDRFRPAVVLADVDLPPGGGVEAIARVKRRAPMTETVAIATAPDREVVLAVVRAGARGIIERTVQSTILARIVRQAAAGEITLPRHHFAYVLDALARAERRIDAGVALAPLSSREREVLALIGQGRRNREIADILSISELTVKCHVHNLLEKLRVPTRAAAVGLAVAAERWPSTEAQLPSAQASSTTER
jgi:DNA-binding NarL/FixJ family response regulator